ncbi:MAG: winged helix-turn-helix transcriptional regulator [Candidatus Bilamarchaeaceae archaeon]
MKTTDPGPAAPFKESVHHPVHADILDLPVAYFYKSEEFIKFLGRPSQKSTEKGSVKSSEKILALIRGNPEISAKEIASVLGISSRAVEKRIANLRGKGLLRRIGPDKGGHWEVGK